MGGGGHTFDLDVFLLALDELDIGRNRLKLLLDRFKGFIQTGWDAWDGDALAARHTWGSAPGSDTDARRGPACTNCRRRAPAASWK